LQIRSSLIRASNLHVLRIFYKHDSRINVNRAGQPHFKDGMTPGYMWDIYADATVVMVDKYSGKLTPEQLIKLENEPKWQFEHAVITGGNIDGFVDALKKWARLDIHSTLPTHIAQKAIKMTARIMLGPNYETIDPPEYHDGMFSEIEVPASKGAGIRVGYESTGKDSNGVPVKFTMTGKKDVVIMAACMLLEQLVSKIKLRFQLGERIEWYDRDIFPAAIAVVVAKIEVKTWNDWKNDPTKMRIFTNVTEWVYMLTKLLMGTFFKLHRSAGYSIGMSWFAGAAANLAKRFKINEKTSFLKFFDYDVSKWDTSLKAIFLGLILAVYARFYRDSKEHHIDFLVTMCLIKFIIDNAMVKMCQWFDDLWRLVIGMMFSGTPETATVNTIYHIFLIIAWILYLTTQVDERMRKKLLTALIDYVASTFDLTITMDQFLEKVMLIFLCYGDDGLVCCKDPEIASVLTLESWSKFLKSFFGMEIKYSNCGEYDQFLSKLDPLGEFVTHDWIAPDGKTYQIPDGPVFLKRRFIEIEHNNRTFVAPARCASDYFARFGKSVADLSNPVLQLYRIHGLVYDTFGPNELAYDFLKAGRDQLVKAMPTIELDIKQVNQNVKDYVLIQEKFKRMMGGENYQIDFTTFPTREYLLDRVSHGSREHENEVCVRDEVPLPKYWIDRSKRRSNSFMV